MAKKKKLAKIVDAVQGILGDDETKKKLKKVKAIRKFVDKMEVKQVEIQAELDGGEAGDDREKLLRRHLETLGTQLSKALKIVEEMEKKSETD